jgi:hypothetical protein
MALDSEHLNLIIHNYFMEHSSARSSARNNRGNIMLEKYFGYGISDQSTPEQRKRLIAVEAALAVAIAAADKGDVNAALLGLENRLQSAADAIQRALES